MRARACPLLLNPPDRVTPAHLRLIESDTWKSEGKEDRSVSRHWDPFVETDARALEREARAARVEMEQLVAGLSVAPANVAVAIRADMDEQRMRLEAIAARALDELEARRTEHEAKLAELDSDIEAQIDELKRRRVQADKAEAEKTYEDTRYTLESARIYAKSGIQLGLESIRVSESSLSVSGQ